MVFKATINQSKLGVIQPNDAKNRCPESLCPFPLQFLEWRIQIDWENNNWTRSLNIAIYQRLADHTTHSQIKIFFSETIPFLRRSILGGHWFSLCSTTLLPRNWTTARVFVRPGTPGPLLGYFNSRPGYFYQVVLIDIYNFIPCC